MRLTTPLARALVGGLAAAGCAPGRTARPADAGVAGAAPPAGAPGAVALAPLGVRTAPCRADTIRVAELRARGLRRELAFRDRPVGWARWERDVRLDLDSVGQPRRIRVIAATRPATRDARRPFAADTGDLVQAWLAGGARVERGWSAASWRDWTRTRGRRTITGPGTRCRPRCTRRSCASRARPSRGVPADAYRIVAAPQAAS
jgi:hypothetical protein